MNERNFIPDPVRSGNLWVFPDGRTLPVVAGGDPTATPPAADDGIVVTVPPAEGDNAPRVFTEEEVAAIRREEKDKLYGDIEAEKQRRTEAENRAAELQRNVEAFNTDREAQAEADRQAQEEAEAARRAQEAEELSAKELLQRREQEFEDRLKETENKWSQQFEELNERATQQEALLEKERAFAALNEYKQNAMAEHGDDIMPHLHRLITGNTTEEIDASISSAIQLTSDIMEDVSQVTASQRGPRGVPATGAGPVDGPMENHESQQRLTADDIRNMTMEQFAQYRPQLLQQARPQR